jgi:hypothetical protein
LHACKKILMKWKKRKRENEWTWDIFENEESGKWEREKRNVINNELRRSSWKKEEKEKL